MRCEASATQATAPSTVELGKSGLVVPEMGVGAWSWGDRSGYWGYGKDYGERAQGESVGSIPTR